MAVGVVVDADRVPSVLVSGDEHDRVADHRSALGDEPDQQLGLV